MAEQRPQWDLVITYEGAEYPLDLNALTKREEIAVAKKTGLDREGFIAGFFADDAEATIAAVWLALRRALGDQAPDYMAVDVPSFGDWVRFADQEAVDAWAAERAGRLAAADEGPTTPSASTGGG